MGLFNEIKGYKKAKGVLEDYLKVEKEKAVIREQIEKGIEKIMHSFGFVDYEVWFTLDQIKINVSHSKQAKLNSNVISVLDDYLGAYGVIEPNDVNSIYIIYDENCVSLEQTTF